MTGTSTRQARACLGCGLPVRPRKARGRLPARCEACRLLHRNEAQRRYRERRAIESVAASLARSEASPSSSASDRSEGDGSYEKQRDRTAPPPGAADSRTAARLGAESTRSGERDRASDSANDRAGFSGASAEERALEALRRTEHSLAIGGPVDWRSHYDELAEATLSLLRKHHPRRNSAAESTRD